MTDTSVFRLALLARANQIGGIALRLMRRPGRSFRLLGWGALLIGGGWLWGVYCQAPPVAVLDVHEADGVAVRGGVMDIIATVQARSSSCITHVRRWLWRLDPSEAGQIEWVYLSDVPYRPPTAVGLDRYRLIIPVPAYVEAGDWHYLAQADDDCSPVLRWFSPQRRSPDLIVHIANPTTDHPAELVAPPGVITLVPVQTREETHP